MRVIDKKTDGETLAVTLLIEPEEFAEALREAYLDDSERYVVPGYAPGLAPRAAIEAVYGPEALFDEAIAAALPAAYGKFLAEEKPRTVGKPEASDITLLAGGDLRFRVRADLCPRVRLGAYKGLRITLPEGADEENFRMAALRAACKEMEGRPSEAMVEERLDATAAREQLNVSRDAVYHLLADSAWLLRETYLAAGLSRPPAQVRAEALDVMLEAASGGNADPSWEFIARRLRGLAARYRALPDDFDETLAGLFKRRAAVKEGMTPEELAADAFGAYLGSIGLDEKRWRAERRAEAEESARCDLLLEAVAEAEGITASGDELLALTAEIAARCGMETAEAAARIDAEPLRRQIARDKACRLIVASAVRA